MIALEIVFWASLALIVYAHAGYPLLLRLLVAARPRRARASVAGDSFPSVSLIVAAHDEEGVIAEKIDNALALDYPAGLLELVVASDGSEDRTVTVARETAARHAHTGARIRVLELPRLGKVKAQDAAVEVASGEILAFSDANAMWERGALRTLVAAFSDPKVGYACGRLRYLPATGANEEGAYWRYETAVRLLESRLGSITAGNGAIYALRGEAYLRLDPRTSHDLSFPFNLVKRGWRAIYEPRAVALERPVATIEGEFRRKRRMMSHAWPAVIVGGMLDPRGYGPTYALEIYSHRLLRYATPLFHVTLLGANIALAPGSALYGVMLAGQLAFLLAAGLARLTGGRSRLLALPYYYLLVTASLAAGLWDWLRRGTPTTWERAEGRG
jgi:cellulose synthase/poly-beta-1,6-N-acetylglucosamine synthase-like glycosyltransferase